MKLMVFKIEGVAPPLLLRMTDDLVWDYWVAVNDAGDVLAVADTVAQSICAVRIEDRITQHSTGTAVVETR